MKKTVILILTVSFILGIVLLVAENLQNGAMEVERNAYGEGKRVESFKVEVEGESWEEEIKVEVSEQEYGEEEIEELFQNAIQELDQVILGENESFNRIEKDLNLVKSLADYPVEIRWELDSYKYMNSEGKIKEDELPTEGTLVELRGNISYLDKQKVYVRSAMIYPRTLEGKEFILKEISDAINIEETRTRQDTKFSLPGEVNGNKLIWNRERKVTGLYVMFLGIMLSVFLVYRNHEQKKEKIKRRQDELKREYPAMVSKLNMLLGTGMTVRNAWERIVKNYEEQKEEVGISEVYEEMSLAWKEIQSGISEGEAYERFGKRCELTEYLKLGALLSQNLRKGSRGISDLLRMEAIQAFENRKSMAKRRGEEAGTKLMLPMMGMLAVVMIMVMIPAFLSMQV